MTRFSARLLALTVAAGLLLTPVAANAAPARPKATSPGVTANVTQMPILTWKKAARATSYEVQIASDAGFNPAMVDVTTGNIRYIHTKVLPNGAYFWRLRALDKDGGASKWTPVRKFTKKWAALATLSTPANLGAISYPSPVILRWSQVSGASTYLDLGRCGRFGRGRRRSRRDHLERRARHQRRRQADLDVQHELRDLVRPARGHVLLADHPGRRRGPRREAVHDLVVHLDVERCDDAVGHRPGARARRFSTRSSAGRRLPGAASYQVEINATSDFAVGSRQMLQSTNATAFALTRTLPNNTYYWRVRGVDPQNQAGPWTNGAAFDKTYDQTAVPGPQRPRGLQLEAARPDRRRRQRRRARRHMGHRARCASLRGPGELHDDRIARLCDAEHGVDSDRLVRQRWSAATPEFGWSQSGRGPVPERRHLHDRSSRVRRQRVRRHAHLRAIRLHDVERRRRSRVYQRPRHRLRSTGRCRPRVSGSSTAAMSWRTRWAA